MFSCFSKLSFGKAKLIQSPDSCCGFKPRTFLRSARQGRAAVGIPACCLKRIFRLSCTPLLSPKITRARSNGKSIHVPIRRPPKQARGNLASDSDGEDPRQLRRHFHARLAPNPLLRFSCNPCSLRPSNGELSSPPKVHLAFTIISPLALSLRFTEEHNRRSGAR